ncbi:MAG: 50S ribosomal protein L23 [Myxococcota bacterium]
MNAHQIIRRPLVTEKSSIGREERNLVTFAVEPKASKHQIRRAVEELFNVEVLEVRTMRMPRKKRRVGKFEGRKPEWKKAIVRLAQEHQIEFFEGV